MCAAGDMIDESIPIAVDTYEDAGCPARVDSESFECRLITGCPTFVLQLHIDQIVLGIDISQSVSGET